MSAEANAASGQNIVLVRGAEAGQRLTVQSIPGGSLKFEGIDPAAAEFSRPEGSNDLVITQDNGGIVVIENFFVVGDSSLPTLTLADGSVVEAAAIFTNLDLSTAAGPAAGAPASGGSSYDDSGGDLLGGLERLNSLDTSYWGRAAESSPVEQSPQVANYSIQAGTGVRLAAASSPASAESETGGLTTAAPTAAEGGEADPAEPRLEPPVENPAETFVPPAEPPVEPDAPPTESPEPPADTPAEPTEPPLDQPVEPVEPPVEPTAPPVAPVEPPLDPVTPPVEPVEPPVVPVEPSVEPPLDPVEPTIPPVEPPAEPVKTPLSVDIIAERGVVYESALRSDGSGGVSGEVATEATAKGSIVITGDPTGQTIIVSLGGENLWDLGMKDLAEGGSLTLDCGPGFVNVQNLGEGRYGYQYTLTESVRHSGEEALLDFSANIFDEQGNRVGGAQSPITIIDDGISLDGISTLSGFSADRENYAREMTLSFDSVLNSGKAFGERVTVDGVSSYVQNLSKSMEMDGITVSTARVANPGGANWVLDETQGGELTLVKQLNTADDRVGLGIKDLNAASGVYEINYNSQENRSEAIVMDLGGKIANTAHFDFRSFYTDSYNGQSAHELMTIAFYLNGEVVATKNLEGQGTWGTAGAGAMYGSYDLSDVGGFDKVVLFSRGDALGDGNPSDFYIKSASFDFSGELVEYSASGSFIAEVSSADGLDISSLAFTDAVPLPQELLDLGYTVSSGESWIKVYDADKALALDMRLNGDGTWDFDQYQLLPTFNGDLHFGITGSDKDGSPFEASLSAVYRTRDGVIHGGDSADEITADNAGDVLYAGAGDDLIHAGAGNDLFYGGAGADTFAWDADSLGGIDMIRDFTLNEDHLSFSTLFGTDEEELNVEALLSDSVHYHVLDLTADRADHLTLTVADQTVDITLTDSQFNEEQMTALGSGEDEEVKLEILQQMILLDSGG